MHCNLALNERTEVLAEVHELHKLTHWPKKICHYAINYLQQNKLELTELGFMRSLNILRTNLGLTDGDTFKQWCIDKQLNMDTVEKTFKQLLLIKRLANAYACEHRLNYGY